MPYLLERFGFKEMMECRSRIRMLFHETTPASLDQVAERAVRFFYDELVDREGQPACALVRFFKSHPYRDLPEDLQTLVRRNVSEPASQLQCLTLLATRGQLPEWNSRLHSRGHQVIPLESVEMVEQAPMIAQLIRQMGIDIASVVQPDLALMLNAPAANYNVFHVQHAPGSPHIVAQDDFVKPYGIASVLGFGGLLSSGDLFAVIMFSRVPISTETAEQFRVLGLNLKMAILPFTRISLFA